MWAARLLRLLVVGGRGCNVVESHVGRRSRVSKREDGNPLLLLLVLLEAVGGGGQLQSSRRRTWGR